MIVNLKRETIKPFHSVFFYINNCTAENSKAKFANTSKNNSFNKQNTGKKIKIIQGIFEMEYKGILLYNLSYIHNGWTD